MQVVLYCVVFAHHIISCYTTRSVIFLINLTRADSTRFKFYSVYFFILFLKIIIHIPKKQVENQNRNPTQLDQFLQRHDST